MRSQKSAWEHGLSDGLPAQIDHMAKIKHQVSA
jgi:hypothetical protein